MKQSPQQPINVLLTVPHLNSTASPYREMIAIAKYLPQPEFALTVCSLRQNGYRETSPMLRELNVRCIVARFRLTGYSPHRFWDWLHDQRSLSRNGPFHLQHSLDFTASPLEAFMARRASRRYIFSQRNMNSEGSRALLRAKIRMAEGIIAISDSTRRLLTDYGAPDERCVTIPLGIDLSERKQSRKPATGNEARYIITVGHIVRRKRMEDTIATLPHLLKYAPDLHLKIVGKAIDSAYYQELIRLSQQLNMANRIEFMGERQDVLELMSRAEALMLCSKAEAFGWVVLEAMLVGTPVVASNVDGPQEVITHGQTGFLAEVGNIEEYVRAIRALLTEDGLRERITHEAQCLLTQKYDARQMVHQIADFYRVVCSQ